VCDGVTCCDGDQHVVRHARIFLTSHAIDTLDRIDQGEGLVREDAMASLRRGEAAVTWGNDTVWTSSGGRGVAVALEQLRKNRLVEPRAGSFGLTARGRQALDSYWSSLLA